MTNKPNLLNDLYPEWVLYQLEPKKDPDRQILRINGRPEVIQLSPQGIRIFTSIEAEEDGLQPLYFHEYLFIVEDFANDK